MDGLNHYSVMLEECMDGLKLKNGGIYFDGTLGGAGHSYEILKRTAPDGKLVATDLDDYALKRADEKKNSQEFLRNTEKKSFRNRSLKKSFRKERTLL